MTTSKISAALPRCGESLPVSLRGGVVVSKPKIHSIPLADGLNFSGAGFFAQEKMDGFFELLNWRGSVFAGERMKSGIFYAFDLAFCGGDDCRRSPFRDRWQALRSLESRFDETMKLVSSGIGGEFLETVLAHGGEGVVFKNPEGFWGVGQFKCKRVETFDVRVMEKFQNSIAIEFENQNAGCCAVLGKKFGAIKIGDVIEIAAFGRTIKGKFREPRFIRSRPDKVCCR